MNKRNGFTLVELLAVIAVLSVISVIASGIIINSLGGAKSDINKVQENNLIDTAKVYYEDNLNYKFDKNLFDYNICIQENLVQEGYLDKFVDDDNNPIKGYIKVSNNNNKYTFEYKSNVDESNCVKCEYGDINQDGVIDDVDREILDFYLVEWKEIREKYSEEFMLKVADVLDDDIINDGDGMYLARYLYGKKPCKVQ